MLIDDFGIILYSNDKDMIFRSLGVLSNEAKEKLENTKRFDDIEISPLTYDLVLNNLPKARDFGFFSFYDEYQKEYENVLIAKVQQFPFYVMLETEEKDVSRSAMLSSLMIGLFVLLAALSAMLMILLIASKFLKPLNRLTVMANEISKGNYETKVEIKSNDEFEDLGRIFNKMAKKLKKSKIKTEEKIQERTEELNKINKFMVNRELKMIELKKEIQKLKNRKNEDKN
jgi:nitrate/nitrite-specific signal transduction histidine kinase